jgi:iron complex outermembrane receptor protein
VLQKGFLVLLIFLGMRLTSQAQQCINPIRGSVFSASGHSPLAFAAVQIPEARIQVYTDEKGQFEICGLAAGRHKMLIRQLGFDSLLLEVETGKKKLVLHLEEQDRWLNAVDVKGKHRHFESEVVENSALHGAELEQSRGVSLGEMLRKIPGVSSIQTGTGIFKPSIQGMTGNRVAILQNGVKLEGQQWGFDHAPETDPGLAEEVIVVRGAQSVRYGSEAMGGSILLDPGDIEASPKPAIRFNSGFSSNGRGFSNGIRLQQKLEGKHAFAWRFSGNGRKSGNFHTAKYYLGNTALEEFSTSGLVRHEFGSRWKNEVAASYYQSKTGIFSGAHISSPEGIRQAFSRPDSSYKYNFSYNIGRPFQKTKHFLIKVKSKYQWTENQETSISLNYQKDQREEYDIIRRSLINCEDCPQLLFALQSPQAEIIHSIKKEGRDLQIGVSGLYQSNVVERKILIPNFRLRQGSIFALANLYRGDWAWEAGIRLESRSQQIFRYVGNDFQNPILKYNYGMANAGTRWEISHHWHARLNLQLTQRPPSVNELFSNGVHQGSASYEKGDENLKPEFMIGFNGSVHHESEYFDVLLNLFWNRSSNYIYLSPVKDSIITSIRGPYPFFLYRQTAVRMAGGDFTAMFKAGLHWQILSSGSLIRSQDLDAKQGLVLQQADRCSFSIRWLSGETAKNKIKLVAEFGPSLVAKQSRAPDSDFTSPPAGYTLWNGRISISKNLGKYPLEASIEGQNLGNLAYRDYLNRFRYFCFDTGRNITFRISVSL